jgi:hypothetical protein
MTHDELIAYIDDSTNGLKHEHLFEKLLTNTKALRAVVELHKPESSRMPFCVECRGVWQGEIDVVLYPCPTIRVIEKEL